MASPHQLPAQVGDTTNLLLKKLVTATNALGEAGGIFLTQAEADALYFRLNGSNSPFTKTSATVVTVPDAFSLTSVGSIALTAGGSNKDITLTTSGAGSINLSAASIIGGPQNMVIVAGTGNSRSLSLRTTTSGGAATTGLAIGPTQVVNLPGIISASSATTGTLTVGNGTAATNVGIGGGNINAGGTLTVAGATVITGQVFVSNANFPPLASQRTTSVTNLPGSAIRLSVVSSGDVTDGFGVLFSFAISDTGVTDSSLGDIGYVRSGADNTGDFIVRPILAGVQSEKLRLSSGGNLTIGGNLTLGASTSSITGAAGNMTITSGTGASRTMVLQTTTSGSAATTAVTLSAAQLVRFNAYGAGALTTDASGNITAASDARLKDIDGDYSVGLAAILQITPKIFHWKKESGFDPTDSNVGLIAQDLIAAGIDGAVSTTRNVDVMETVQEDGQEIVRVKRDSQGYVVKNSIPADYYSISDRAVMAAMINAIKELAARVTALENN